MTIRFGLQPLILLAKIEIIEILTPHANHYRLIIAQLEQFNLSFNQVFSKILPIIFVIK
jgi:hypothetical protein